MVSNVDAAAALADLTEISNDVESAAIVAESGELLAATPGGERLAEPAVELLRTAAERVGGGRTPTRIGASLRSAGVFVLHEGGRTVVARTRPNPPAALLFHDLTSCLRSLEENGRA
jgi:hypothetical protein